LTGAIFPIGEVFSDSKRNIIASMIFAARFDIPEGRRKKERVKKKKKKT
jgi:hypothetical protein